MHILTVSIIAFCWIALKISLESFLLKLSCLMFSCKFFSTVLSASIAIGANENLLLKYVSWRIGIKGWRCNFSLVACYSLKCTRCSLFVVTSLVTRCKSRSLLVAKSHSLLVAKIHSLLVAKFTWCKKLLVTCCEICLLLAATNHLLLNTSFIIHHSLKQSQVLKDRWKI